ncbi:MAG TPA: proline racemase family protein [Pseudonocardiaceae bacterium]|nr:proline racemase family protein [Pseudonocardiaceae bacterium]
MDAVQVVDYHTAGEPFRIVVSGAPDIVGDTVLARREFARGSADVDAVRRLLVSEPRGHADMYGCFVVPADDAGAHFGVLFWHQDGYSTACGHGTIALGVWAVTTGRVPASPDGVTDVVIDVPSGRVVARVSRAGGVVTGVSFRNVAAYPVARGVEVTTPRGPARVDVSYGGALYASLDAASVGLTVVPEHHAALVATGRAVKAALRDSPHARHPEDSRLDGIYGTILYDDLGTDGTGPHQRNVTVFADGQVDRSPCGSGTSARLALLAADGRITTGQALRHDSIVGTTFLGRVVEHTVAAGRPAVVTEIEGNAYRTGTARSSSTRATRWAPVSSSAETFGARLTTVRNNARSNRISTCL